MEHITAIQLTKEKALVSRGGDFCTEKHKKKTCPRESGGGGAGNTSEAS